MTTARTLVRFAFAGLFVNAMAVACVVSDNNDDSDNMACEPNTYKDCTCPDGDESTRKCNASGSGYGACACADGAGGEGNTPTAGTGGTAAGTAGTATTYGGESNGGAGGEAAGGMSGGGGQAGAGGDDVCILDPGGDDCQSCVQVDCCDAWTACSAETEGDCQQEVLDIMACAKSERGPDDAVTPAELQSCGEATGSGTWPAGILPTTKAVIDCVAGQGWTAEDSLAGSQCDSLCFAAE